MKTLKITKSEALRKLGRWYGQKLQYTNVISETLSAGDADYIFLRYVNDGLIKSFRFTSLRRIDEITEEERVGLHKKCYGVSGKSIWQVEASGIDYLRSIGVDPTGEDIDTTFEIID